MPVSQMHLQTNVVSQNLSPLSENCTALDKILGDFVRFSSSFPSPKVKRNEINLSYLIEPKLSDYKISANFSECSM